MQLDNEASTKFHALTKENNIYFQMLPPFMHRLNANDRSISTFKDHFIVGLCTTDSNFPMQNWDRLLEHADITLNLLCPSRLNPILSAYAHLNGEFDFNSTPMSHLGTRNLICDKPQNRGTWNPHGHTGCYLRPEMLYYFCLIYYTPKTDK